MGAEGMGGALRPAWRHQKATIYQGSADAVFAQLPGESVHCVVTSPPYYGLRRYLAAGHADAALELGTERTPDEYVARLVAILGDVRRVLRSDGTLWLNVGDSYSGNRGNTAEKPGYDNKAAGTRGADLFIGRKDTGLPEKNLCLIPERLSLALQADDWIVRSKIRWCKVACMPESVTDRPTSAVEEIFMLAKSPRYFYDAEAVRETALHEGRIVRASGNGAKNAAGATDINDRRTAVGFTTHDTVVSGRNQRNYWLLPPQPFSAADLHVDGVEHFATFPLSLPTRCILAGTSERGCCPACGAGYVRVVEKSRTFESGSGRSGRMPGGKNGADFQGGGATLDVRRGPTLHTVTSGWIPGCACDAGEPVSCVVADPFSGAATTGLAALQLGRRYVGAELNADYIRLSAARLRGAASQASIFDAGEEAS